MYKLVIIGSRSSERLYSNPAVEQEGGSFAKEVSITDNHTMAKEAKMTGQCQEQACLSSFVDIESVSNSSIVSQSS